MKKTTIQKIFIGALGLITSASLLCTWLLFSPVKLEKPYNLTIKSGQGYSQTVRELKQNKVIRSYYITMVAAYVTDAQKSLKPGRYTLKDTPSAWNIIQHLKNGHPDKAVVRIPEGMTFAQFRNRVNSSEGLTHTTKNMSEEQLLKTLDSPYTKAEGLFFPDTYVYDWGESDMVIYRQAYNRMQEAVQQAWTDKKTDLPYNNAYELLIMASIIEKETAHANDRAKVAAVFVNRLKIGMKLQTDPTVIYGMGDRYKGTLYRSEWRRDSEYNPYTRHGLTPTPIALPGKAALEAAANPSDDQYLYFVSRMDGTGLSQFSHTLNEHNQAVNKYIRKKK